MTTYSVVVPAYQAGATLGEVLDALRRQSLPPLEVIVVDDVSTDATGQIAGEHCARVLRHERPRYAGGARNTGWDAAAGDVVVFLDADDVPCEGWGEGLLRALSEWPGAIVGCARTFTPTTAWGWVAHLQNETPRLPRGGPRRVPFVAGFCVALHRSTPLRFSESYGGEDALLCADAAARGIPVVFDPRISTRHVHGRSTYGELRAQQRRVAFSQARCGAVQREGRHKRLLTRLPLHYFVLARLPVIAYRVRTDPVLRRRFVKVLPRLAAAEWTLGASALRYSLSRPSLRGVHGAAFRGAAPSSIRGGRS
jgi:glycosyltransferase involved in cell wall biosynthesis